MAIQNNSGGMTTVFSYGQLLGLGYTAATIRSDRKEGRIERLRRGWYIPKSEVDPRERHVQLIRATLTQMHPDSVLSHESAGIIHQLPLPTLDLERASVTRSDPALGHGRRTAAVHLRIAPLAADDVVLHESFPVTSLARTAVDLARSLPYEWGVIVCDAALAKGLDRAELEEEVARGRRRRGNQVALRAVAFADGRSGSPLESLSRVQFARLGLPTPELQFVVPGLNNPRVISDFAWPELRTVGEADGRSKYDQLLQPGQSASGVVMAEKRREQRIRDSDFSVFRWGWDEAQSLDALSRRAQEGFRQGRRLVALHR